MTQPGSPGISLCAEKIAAIVSNISMGSSWVWATMQILKADWQFSATSNKLKQEAVADPKL
ncbi:MAG: hypothetical protein HC866_05240 [Leptolyngbyaceae cyanobacterium RU_5_1]|nr:hypothetical protein [Leptolyngbyaceae cyanobacterium RU_5_1]